MNRKPVKIRFLFLLFGLLLLVSCAGGTSTVVRSHFVEFTPGEKQEILADQDHYYRIQDGDILNVAFAYLKELNQDNILVLPDGSVNLMGIDRLVLSGLTMIQADSLITQSYAKDYLDPELSLILNETKGRQVYVMGEVGHPGLYSLPRGGIEILAAITTAGGFTDDAGKDGVVVIRADMQGYYVTEVDLSRFQDVASGPISMVDLEAYDIVYVPRSGMGSFSYFSKTILTGISQMARIAADVKYLSAGTSFSRF